MRTILLSRRSIRAFSDKPVSQELVGQLIEMGVHAGTASNGQTESFIIIQDRKVLTELEHIVINVLWKAGLRYMGSGIGSRIARMKLGDEMTRQAVTYYHIIKNRRKNNQLAGMIFRNTPIVIVCHGLRTNYMAHANCATAARNMEIMAAKTRPMAMMMAPVATTNRAKRLRFILRVGKLRNLRIVSGKFSN